MKAIEEFVEQARKKFESQPFINDYLNKKLKYKEAVGTYLYNQWVYTCQIEGLCKDAGLLEDIKEICIKENLKEAWKAEWPYDADDISKPWVEPSVMYATQSWCDEIHKIKEDKDLLGHLMWVAGEVAREMGVEDSFRLVVNNGAKAGQSVFHVHVHLLSGRPFSWPPG